MLIVCVRQCPYPQDCSLNWIDGALINYNCAELPAGRRNCANEYGDQIHERAVNWTLNQLSSCPADVLSERGTCDVRSHVASCGRT